MADKQNTRVKPSKKCTGDNQQKQRKHRVTSMCKEHIHVRPEISQTKIKSQNITKHNPWCNSVKKLTVEQSSVQRHYI
jgi:hypothetical protein